MFKTLLRYFNTIKYLEPKQVYLRVLYKIYFPVINVNVKFKKNEKKIKNIIFLDKENSFNENKFTFLNISKDYKKNNSWKYYNTSKLWTYNLHYFDYINVKKNVLSNDIVIGLINDWINNNYSRRGIGWESYPLSLRIINWIKWSITNNIQSNKIDESLYIQSRWLNLRVEYFLQGNHLISNAKALIYSGLYFSTKESNNWLCKGLKILNEELDKQILNDGGHFELSTMYQLIVLEDLIDIFNLMRVYNYNNQIIIQKLEKKIIKMISWSMSMQHPDGKISFFNDAAFNIAQDFPAIKKYSQNLGIPIPAENNNLVKINYLSNSGYVSIKNHDLCLIVDIAQVGSKIQPGHAHADSLSFEMSIAEDRFIVNSGTSTYDENKTRKFQRSTLAHSTVTINNQNSSDVWKSFRVAERANITEISVNNNRIKQSVEASHDGYRPIKHTRQWICENNYLLINDKIIGKFKSAIARLYLHPGIKIINETTFKTPKEKIIKLSSNNNYKIIKSTWHPEFGKQLKNHCIEIKIKSSLNETKFSW